MQALIIVLYYPAVLFFMIQHFLISLPEMVTSGVGIRFTSIDSSLLPYFYILFSFFLYFPVLLLFMTQYLLVGFPEMMKSVVGIRYTSFDPCLQPYFTFFCR